MLLGKERAGSAPSQSTEELPPSAGFGPEDFVFADLDAHNLVFSEANQAIYELTDLSAFVWRSIDDGLSNADVVRQLMVAGLHIDQAESAVEVTMRERRKLSAATTSPAPFPITGPSERLALMSITIAGVAVQLYLSKALIADVEAVFGHLATDVPEADVVLCARSAGNIVVFLSPGQDDWSCPRNQFIPLLKAQLIESVLQSARYEVALHAAALSRGNGAVLLMGSPGSGKTTLGIALAKAGLEVLADDVVLLGKDGLVTGVALPFTAKSTSWDLLASHWPGIADFPGHCRPDGQTLCYIPHGPLADPRPQRIGAVVILDRQENVQTQIEELDLACALAVLVAEGATRDERLSPSGFSALVAGLREARCCRLTYSNLMEAAETVCRFNA